MRLLLTLLATCAIALSVPVLPAVAQAAPTISVNGQTVSFDQPPVERAGRVYVPLRGVFEQLGASVVYQNGQINATRGSTTVALTIGNSTATVNGQPQQLDSPPFVIGARTLVPLRFVAQALGATVSYNASSNSVAIAQSMPNIVITPVPRQAPPPRAAAAPMILALALVRPEPPNGSTVDGARPQISATFPQRVQADSLRIRLDGRDVAAASYVSDRSFSYDTPADLPFGTHRVQVAGRAADGPRFAAAWSFVNRPVQAANFLRGLQPLNGTQVGFAFTVRGVTEPGSQVHLIATASDRLPFGEVQQTSSIADVTAGADGGFVHTLAVADGSGSIIDVRITSRAPDGATAVATLHLRP
jgi:hypothetical protein